MTNENANQVCGVEAENDELEKTMKSLEKMTVKLEDCNRYHDDLVAALPGLKAEAESAPAEPVADTAQIAALERAKKAAEYQVARATAAISKIKSDITQTKGWITQEKAVARRRVRVPVRRRGGWSWYGRRFTIKRIRPNYRKIQALANRIAKLNIKRGYYEKALFNASNQVEDLNEKLAYLQQPEPADQGHDLAPLKETLAQNVQLAESLVAKIKAVTI